MTIKLNPSTALAPAPSDADAERAYGEIMRTAQAHGLIVQAAGGVATIAIPAEQRKAGIREHVLKMVRMRERTEADDSPNMDGKRA